MGMLIFFDFISRIGLFDFPLNGRQFTRFDRCGKNASKLDRFLVAHNFFDIWLDAIVSVLCRSYSDHCPIMIRVESRNFRPKPFRVFDKWIGDLAFLNVIAVSWAANGYGCFLHIVLKNKIKNHRMDINLWTSDKITA